MKISQSMIDLGTNYFSPIIKWKPMSQWTRYDSLKVASYVSCIIPLLVAAVMLTGYAIKGRVKKDLHADIVPISDKISGISNSSIVKKPAISQLPNSTGVGGKLATIFVASHGLSQHSPKYQAIVGKKTNKDKTQENVCFAHASCTPLAISFAVTASEANKTKNYANENAPANHLDDFLGEKARVNRGIQQLQKMISNPKSGVTIDSLNLGGEEGLEVYNAMMEKTCIAKRTYNGNQNSYYYYDSVAGITGMVGDAPDWHATALKNLKKGEGALIILGGYSIGVRRIENSFEIFDSHNANSYTGKTGACIIHCPNIDEFVKNIEKIRHSGSAAGGFGGQAEAQGVEIYVF